MAKILRKNAKIFGSTAGALEIGQFGSLAAGSIAYSTDPDTIQALTNYLAGWFAAVVGSNSPAIEDMNALFYLFAYQIAYTMQTGVAEWNSGTTYFIGSLVNDGNGNLYKSLTNNNTNNALTDTTKWALKPDPENNAFVSSESQLSAALTAASSAGGGVICLGAAFSLSSALTVPAGTRLIGRNGLTLLTILSGGSLTLATGAVLEDVWVTTALTSGDMVKLANSYSIVQRCQFTLPSGGTGNCINVTGNGNRIRDCIFSGALGGTATGIAYTSGAGNFDDGSVFLP